MSDYICPYCGTALAENEVCDVCRERRAVHREYSPRAACRVADEDEKSNEEQS